jgi:hypothetical protein
MEEYQESKVSKHGTLVTAASLFFLVIYTTGDYDGWDLIVSAIATFFGVSFLISSAPKDKFELLIGSLISCGGVLFGATSIYSMFKYYKRTDLPPLTKWDKEPISILFVLTIAMTLLVFCVCLICRRKKWRYDEIRTIFFYFAFCREYDCCRPGNTVPGTLESRINPGG